MNIEILKKFKLVINNVCQVVLNIFCFIFCKYDCVEYQCFKELDMVVLVLDGFNEGDLVNFVGVSQIGKGKVQEDGGVKNGVNMMICLGVLEFCYGDIGFLFVMLCQGLGNVVIVVVVIDEQLECFKGKWVVMVIIELGVGLDLVVICIIVKEDGDYYVFNGEKIYVIFGECVDCVVVWVSLDFKLGCVVIKLFVVEWGILGMELVCLEKKFGICVFDIVVINFSDCWVFKENLFGNLEVDIKGFGGVMEIFDNICLLVVCFVLGVVKVLLEWICELFNEVIEYDYGKLVDNVSVVEVELYCMEVEWEVVYWLVMKVVWMVDNKQFNLVEVLIFKVKVGCVGNYVIFKCVELVGFIGYIEDELLEKWVWDLKIFDIFEGIQ